MNKVNKGLVWVQCGSGPARNDVWSTVTESSLFKDTDI